MKTDVANLQLEELQILRRELREKLGALRVPPPAIVRAFNQEYPVPSTVEVPEEPSTDMVRYLSGHFAGTGHISLKGGALITAESGPNASNLILFQKYCGGRLSWQRSGSGLHRATLRWRVSGPKARRAALMMSQSGLQKKQQLQSLAAGLTGDEEPEAHESVFFQHWSEVAGFLDACLFMQANARGSVKARVMSQHTSLLQAFRAFIQRHVGPVPNIIKVSGLQYEVSISQQEVARPILEAAINAGLCVKSEAAKAFLTWTKDTHWEVREKLEESKGYHSRFTRYDEEAAARSGELEKLRRRLRRMEIHKADMQEIRLLGQQINDLAACNQRLRLLEEIGKLQSALESVGEEP